MADRDDLTLNLIGQLAPCGDDIQERMIAHFTSCDADYGRRVAEGLAEARRAMHPGSEPMVKTAPLATAR